MRNATAVPILLVLLPLLVLPCADALGARVDATDANRRWVDSEAPGAGATVSADGAPVVETPLPRAPSREGKTLHPVRAEVATGPRGAAAGDLARADAGGDRNVTTDAAAWTNVSLEAAAPSAETPAGATPALGVVVAATGADAVETRSAPANRAAVSAAAAMEARRALAPGDAIRASPFPPSSPPQALADADGPTPAPAPQAPPRRQASATATPGPTAAEGPTAAAELRLVQAAALATGLAALLLAAGPLYHRVRSRDVLANGTRGRLHALLRERPGLRLADAARELRLDPTTARYHLRRLEREGLASSAGPARRARYFAAGCAPGSAQAEPAESQASSRVLDAVREAPGATKSRLAERLALARPTVSWHLDRLAERGRVTFERVGREVRVRAT